MLTVLRDTEHQIEAAMDWYLVNDQGRFDVEGRWVWVEQIETNDGQLQKDLMRRFVQQIATVVPLAVGAYWIRHDSTGMKSHNYLRARLLRFASQPTRLVRQEVSNGFRR